MRVELTEAPIAARAPRWLLAVVIGLVLLPLGAAVAGQLTLDEDYNAAGDLADIELHTRDVGRHQVEIGQYSREERTHDYCAGRPGP